MLGLLNSVLAKGGTLLNYVKDGLVMANRFLTPPKLTFPADASAEFNGTSDYIQLDNAFSHTNHTFACWGYLGDSSATRMIFDNRETGTDGLAVFYGSNDAVFIRINTTFIYTTATYQEEWIFITGTYDGTTHKLYINGSLEASASISQTIDTASNARIGLRTDVASDYFKGNLANVAIWNRALSSDEINSVMWKGYNALNTTEKSGLQAWYSLEESELFDVSDTSTTNLEEYAKLNGAIFEGKACLQTALNAFPDITDARLYSGRYDARVSGDGGTVEALSCVETELNAIL